MSNFDNLLVKDLVVHTDDRGWLAEILKNEDLENGKKEFGQFFVTVAKKGKAKGGHYHKRKVEWFCVIHGKGSLVLKDVDTGDVRKIILDGKHPKSVKITPLLAHKIFNIGDEDMYLLAYTNEQLDKKDPDSYDFKFD